MDKFRRGWKYKNLTLVALGLIAAFYLSRIEIFHEFLIHLGGAGFIGAFIAGILFVSTFTVATGALILFTLAEYLHPPEIAIIAGLGAVVGDLIIFRLIKDNLVSEIEDIYKNHLGGEHVSRLFHTKYFSWALPVIGAVIIASPFPDELGISLMGISKMGTYQFIFVSFILNAIGIFLVVSASLVL
ncbi:MAG: hypothetical protein Q8N98_04850 [bacterium]|nr:hypothetical protein [bacterium]